MGPLTAVVLFTRDLRVHDNPALSAGAAAGDVVPLFVRDPAIRAPQLRLDFVHGCLDELARALGGLLVCGGDVVEETARVVAETGAEVVFAARDASAYAQRREARLADAVPLRLVDAVTAAPFDALKPYRLFAPYYRAWSKLDLGEPLPPPAPRLHRIATPPALHVPGRYLEPGERAARGAAEWWFGGGLARYGRERGGDDIGERRTSRLSPYLHLGCVSARELVVRARRIAGSEPWVRELCWRDFYAQLLRAEPRLAHESMHPRAPRRERVPGGLEAWREGRTGYPLVDAGMRQLAQEGWMHNRARLVAASFLVHDLGVPWQEGARVYDELLLDGDVASNTGNWQWVAGTGVDHTRGGRIFNPTLQARRRDPGGTYVRRYLPALADVADDEVHRPRDPIVDHAEIARRPRGERLF